MTRPVMRSRGSPTTSPLPVDRRSGTGGTGQPEPGSDSSPTGERPGDDGSRQDDGTERTPLGLLGDRERRRVLNAVRSYRRSDPGGRPSVAWVRERARLGQGRLRAADITAALAEVDAESDPQPDSEPADTTASAPINDAAVLLDVTPAN